MLEVETVGGVMQLEVEVKDCPFCGSGVRAERTVCEFVIMCRRCRARIVRAAGSEDRVIEMWNKRVK